MKNTKQPYHKYVFDIEKRKFVGKFEEMYQGESIEGYDSWFQEDLTKLDKQLSITMLGKYNFDRILDIGCGKGSFTSLLKKANNYVMGIDISETAIAKAKAKYPAIDFRKFDVSQLSDLVGEHFDLIVAMEILSYLKDWRDVVRAISKITKYFYLTLYIPDNPIGFVESFNELIAEISKYFEIEIELLLDREKILLLTRVKE